MHRNLCTLCRHVVETSSFPFHVDLVSLIHSWSVMPSAIESMSVDFAPSCPSTLLSLLPMPIIFISINRHISGHNINTIHTHRHTVKPLILYVWIAGLGTGRPCSKKEGDNGSGSDRRRGGVWAISIGAFMSSLSLVFFEMGSRIFKLLNVHYCSKFTILFTHVHTIVLDKVVASCVYQRNSTYH